MSTRYTYGSPAQDLRPGDIVHHFAGNYTVARVTTAPSDHPGAALATTVEFVERGPIEYLPFEHIMATRERNHS